MVQKESPIPSSSDKSHVIRTTAQWNSSGDQYHVIPRGVLCIELTSNGKTKIKVGEGNKCYSQLPYISDMEDLSNYYTKEEVDLIVENLEFMSIKSTEEYESRNQLPKTGNKLGDVRFVKNPNNQHDDPLLYVWNGSKWVFSGGSIIRSLKYFLDYNNLKLYLTPIEIRLSLTVLPQYTQPKRMRNLNH